jgi:hypothetical protein
MNPDTPVLQLLGGEEDDDSGLPRYDPGAVMPAVLRLEAGRGYACRAIYATAHWRAEGGGIADAGVSRQVCISRNRIDPGMTFELPFDYQLPFYPWTYGGELVDITWELRIQIDAPRTTDRAASAEFILAPPAPGRRRPRRGAATAKRGE